MSADLKPPTTLLALHGFTLNGARMRDQLAELPARFGQTLRVLYPDAPNVCAPETVARMYRKWRAPAQPAPHLCWWTASDDGSDYAGWPATRALLTRLAEEHAPLALLGFSQGAIVAATLAALSDRGEFPSLRCVVCIAGGVPRASDIQPLFGSLIRVPSLHVWGDRDPVSARSAPLLAERFDAPEVCTWRGSHSIPILGEAADAIARFVERQSGVP